MPGRHWVKLFLERHPRLAARRANLIKRARAEVSRQTVEEFFNNYTQVAHDIPPENIFNYDKTNLRDEPKTRIGLFRRGTKYAEQVGDSSKSAISIMFCGTASGTMLPLYVVYSSKYCYHGWCKGGPEGTKFSATPSGWFDCCMFRNWFFDILLPYARRLLGQKA